MKINYHFITFGLLIMLFIFGTQTVGLCQEIERVTVDDNGQPKQYDVIEIKRYKVIEVEESPQTPDSLNSVAEQAIADAEKDAAAHLNRPFWFSAGFFFPIIGTVVSQYYQPFMPSARVLGKPSEYVAFYYDAYKVRTKKLQFNWAMIGCLIGTPVSAYTIQWMF